mmetsp:Transcript_47973/g.78130  ORF Transcript_47973/g.78130 Transcript_47973/m.78130 type:complete len:115 (+) Transcript_47973:2053-2397(+)
MCVFYKCQAAVMDVSGKDCCSSVHNCCNGCFPVHWRSSSGTTASDKLPGHGRNFATHHTMETFQWVLYRHLCEAWDQGAMPAEQSTESRVGGSKPPDLYGQREQVLTLPGHLAY